MKGFRRFILRGNVVDLAVGVVIGAAFTAVVSAFTATFLTPLIALATGATGSFKDLKATVVGVDVPYGQFVQAMLSFLLTALVVYFLVVIPVNRLMERFRTEPEPTDLTRVCPECLSKIPAAARRCAFCTAESPPELLPAAVSPGA